MPERSGELKTVHAPDEAHAAVAGARAAGKTVGVVPTMGALHEGHLSLIRRAREECDFVAVSIYVNPLQFGESADLEAYPRTLDDDVKACDAAGVDLVFAPASDAMYAPDHTTWVEVGQLTQGLCGMSRPGHFRGVTTIVTKLFGILAPDRAYFGMKDYQQLVVVERMVRDLNMPVKIVRCPIVREKDGLAMSSRNARLSSEERAAAVALSEALGIFVQMVSDGERDVAPIMAAMSERIIGEPHAELDYLSIVDARTLEDVRTVAGEVVAALAVWMGKTRLIDNAVVRVSDE
jgi:pantoate--beta-alanine ligase